MDSPTAPESKPYKGPLSYEIEDGPYFFGRDRESDLLAAKILSSRFTLLHAQSGTGKTSLLNARVIPALEEEGWSAFRILLRQNPSEAVRLGSLFGVLPPPAVEAEAIARVLRVFWAPGEDPTLNSILDNIDYSRNEFDPHCLEVLQPIEETVTVKSAGLSFTGQFRPLFLRLLRATLEVSQYSEHLKVLLPATGLVVDGETHASALIAALGSPEASAIYADLIARLYSPVPSLREYFANLVEVYGRRRTQFQLVLVLDQFEELFTLFSDSLASPGKQLWRLRWEFLEQLEALYEAGSSLPLRYVISMRDEYIAQLDPLRRFIRDLDAGAFHLSFLEKEEARASILEPARLFGYEYTDDCFANIFSVLLREDRFVEPAPLQIICEKLWQQQGKALATNDQQGELKKISLASLPAGGTRGILDSFFDETLQSVGDVGDRLEILEMLEPLVTASGTRNIVEYTSLVNAPFRQRERRAALLDRIASQRIVRIEQRLGGQFVEITHEFLIASILDRIRKVLNTDSNYGQLRWAIRTLERFEDVDFRAGSFHLLESRVFADLDAHMKSIRWNEWSTELMLRSAVAVGAGADSTQRWAQLYRDTGANVDIAEMLTPERIRDRARSLLSPDEMAALSSREVNALTADQVEFVFRSHIRQSQDREQIVRWAHELRRACSETQS